MQNLSDCEYTYEYVSWIFIPTTMDATMGEHTFRLVSNAKIWSTRSLYLMEYPKFFDCFTNYVIAVPVPNKDTLVVAKAFYRSFILVHGAPGRVTADGGGEFVSRLMQRLNKWLLTFKGSQ